jgi:hypothetical protein
MLSEGLKFFTDLPLTIMGLMIFLVAFMSITTWTLFRAQAKEFYQKVAEMPLREEQE